MNWKLTSLYPMALTLVHQLYQRYRFCDAGHPFWMFYRQWKDQGLTLLISPCAIRRIAISVIIAITLGSRSRIAIGTRVRTLCRRALIATFAAFLPVCYYLGSTYQPDCQ